MFENNIGLKVPITGSLIFSPTFVEFPVYAAYGTSEVATIRKNSQKINI